MARPINADADATRGRILSAASHLFAAGGIGRTSIRAVARDADVSVATIHHYFGSKDGLHRACIEALYARLRTLQAAFDERMIEGAPPRAVLEAAVRTGFPFAIEHREPIRLIMRTVVDTGGIGAEWREAALVPFLNDASDALGRLLDRPGSSLRLPLQSMVFLVARYALADPQELAVIAGSDDPGGAEARERVVAHLIRAALALFDIEPTTNAPGDLPGAHPRGRS